MYSKFIIPVFILLTTVFKTYAQDDFLVYGKVGLEEGTDKVSVIVRTKEKVIFEKQSEANGTYELFIDYGKNYKIIFSYPNYQSLQFDLLLDLPEGVKECCFTPLELNFHLFKPDRKNDELFTKAIYEIAYREEFKNFNYDVDVDFKVHKMIVAAEIAKQKAIKDSATLAAMKDSLELEEKYMDLVNRGNLLYAANQFNLSKDYFEKALQLKPTRRYPKYKLEDIQTELNIFNKHADSLGISLDSLLPKETVIDTVKKKLTVYKPISEEEIKTQFFKDLERNIYKNAESQEEMEQMLAYTNEKLVTEPKYTLTIDTVKIAEIEESPKPIELNVISENTVPEPIIEEPNIVYTSDTIKEIDNFDFKAYQDSLARVYPTTKTVEVIKDVYKKVTRVIINKNNIVTIYLKVEHDWGATFYFIDRTPFDPENISSSYFYHATMIDEKSENE